MVTYFSVNACDFCVVMTATFRLLYVLPDPTDGVTDVSSRNLRKTFATRLLSRGAAITDVQHLLGHASVKTTEKAYAAFVKNERFKQTIDLLDEPVLPTLSVVR